jgi:hypothetical protein
MTLHVHPKDVGLALPRILRPKRKRARPSGPSEASIQGLVEAYLRLRSVPYFRVPDAAYRAIFAGQASHGTMREASAYLKGLPDVLLLVGGRYLALELKRDGGKLTAAQRLWRAAIGTRVAHSWEEAQEIINEFLNPKPKGNQC